MMTPQQALVVLDQMSARAPGNRDDHIAATHAVAVLRQAITPPEPPAKGETPTQPTPPSPTEGRYA